MTGPLRWACRPMSLGSKSGNDSVFGFKAPQPAAVIAFASEIAPIGFFDYSLIIKMHAYSSSLSTYGNARFNCLDSLLFPPKERESNLRPVESDEYNAAIDLAAQSCSCCFANRNNPAAMAAFVQAQLPPTSNQRSAGVLVQQHLARAVKWYLLKKCGKISR